MKFRILKLLNYILNVNFMLRQITDAKKIRRVKVGEIVKKIFPSSALRSKLNPKLIMIDPSQYIDSHLFIFNHIFLSLYFHFENRGNLCVTLERVEDNILRFTM